MAGFHPTKKDLESGSDCSLEPEKTTSQMATQQVVPTFNLSFPPSIHLPKLDGTNWQQWSAMLGALMRMNRTHRHLTHSNAVHPDPANPDADIQA